eukprot:173960-Prorocentrum_minimum.AAC.3
MLPSLGHHNKVDDGSIEAHAKTILEACYYSRSHQIMLRTSGDIDASVVVSDCFTTLLGVLSESDSTA